jgi:hypothetical protein
MTSAVAEAAARPFGLVIGLGALAVLVLFLGLFRPATPDRRCGWIALVGLIALSGYSFALQPGESLFGGAFVVDPQALVAPRVLLG